jgi:hypothetical protein
MFGVLSQLADANKYTSALDMDPQMWESYPPPADNTIPFAINVTVLKSVDRGICRVAVQVFSS